MGWQGHRYFKSTFGANSRQALCRMIWFPSVKCKKDASPIYDTGFLVLLSTEMKAAMSYTQSKIIVSPILT